MVKSAGYIYVYFNSQLWLVNVIQADLNNYTCIPVPALLLQSNDTRFASKVYLAVLYLMEGNTRRRYIADTCQLINETEITHCRLKGQLLPKFENDIDNVYRFSLSVRPI